MPINCLSSVQCIINKKQGASLPPGVVLITSLNAPGPFNPFFNMTPTSTTRSSNNIIIGCTCVVSNQTAPYTFLNGTYVMQTSCLTNQINNGGTLHYAFSGEGSSDQMQSPSGTYNTSGVYTGSVSTTVSGSAVTGEWMQIFLPYKLLVTTYSIMTGAAGGGGTCNQMFPKNFTLAGSNNGTTWFLIDNRTGYSATSANGINRFTACTNTNSILHLLSINRERSWDRLFPANGRCSRNTRAV
jgi:hypothetical protein